MDEHNQPSSAAVPSEPQISHLVADSSHSSTCVVTDCEWGCQQDGVVAMESAQMISVPASAQNSQESGFHQENGTDVGKDLSGVDVERMQQVFQGVSFPNPQSSVGSEHPGVLQEYECKEQTIVLGSEYELRPSDSEHSILSLGDPKVDVREENAVKKSENYEGCLQTSNIVCAEEQDLANPPNGLNCTLDESAENISGMDIGVDYECGPRSTVMEFSCLPLAGQMHSEIIQDIGEAVEALDFGEGRNFGVGSDCGSMALAEASEQEDKSPNRKFSDVVSTFIEVTGEGKVGINQVPPTTLQEVSECGGGLDTVQCSDALSARELVNAGNSGCYARLCIDGEDSKLEQKASQDDVAEPLKDQGAGKESLKTCSSQQVEGSSEYDGTGSEIGPGKQLEPGSFLNEQEIEYTKCGMDQIERHGQAVANPHLMGQRPGVEGIETAEILKDVEVEGMSVGTGKNSSSIVLSNKALTDDRQLIVAEGENLNHAESEDASPGLGMNDLHATENIKNSYFVKDNAEHMASIGLSEECSERAPIGDSVSEEHITEQVLKGENEELVFSVGDLVWAKVKSHPWWPGQIFDPADASSLAKKVQKPGRVLVAFFGDCTFGWLQRSQLIAFHPHFAEKVKQTTMKSFCRAVAEALDEVCRRVELGLSCSCHGEGFYSVVTFPDGNNGIQTGGRIKVHKDISSSRESFMPESTYEFIMDVASSPLSFWNFTLQDAELRGKAYAFCASILGLGKPSHLQKLQQSEEAAVEYPLQFSRRNLKRKLSALEGDSCDFVQGGVEVKNEHLCIDVSSSKKGRVSKKSHTENEGDFIKTPTSRSSVKKKMRTSSVLKERGKVIKEVQDRMGRRQEASLRKGKRVASQGPERDKKDKRDYKSPVEARLLKSRQGGEPEVSLASDDDSETLFGPDSYRRRTNHKNTHMKEQLSSHRMVQKKELSSPYLEQVEGTKKNIKTLKVGECIQRIASELTGTPFMKRLDRTVAKRSFSNSGRKSVPKKDKRGLASGSAGHKRHKKFIFSDFAAEKAVFTFAPVLKELLALAKDPFTSKTLKKRLEVRDTVLKFRGMVFQKSAGFSPSPLKRSGGLRGKAGARHANANQGVTVSKVQYQSEDIALSDQRKDVKVYSVTRKRRFEGAQKNQVKKSVKKSKKGAALVSQMS